MSNLEVYDQNLLARLDELRQGDRAYDLHFDTILEAVDIADRLMGDDSNPRRILDVGCGLGFIAAKLAQITKGAVVGIDPSDKAIELAKQEHRFGRFYTASAEGFAQAMPELGESPFSHAILNMVLHSVNDDTAGAILSGVKQCLQPEGAVAVIVPTQTWLMDKLVQYAQEQGMARKPGIKWVAAMMAQDQVELPVKINGGQYYPNPITIFNRTLADYGSLLQASGFGIGMAHYGADGNKLESSVKPYWQTTEYSNSNDLDTRWRAALLSFALPDSKTTTKVMANVARTMPM